MALSKSLSLTDVADFKAGDIVTWRLPRNLPHIGIVSDKKSSDGVPLIIHNIGSGTQEEDILFKYQIVGHYREKRLFYDREYHSLEAFSLK